MSGIRETSEATMVAAHKAGQAYWERNRPRGARPDSLASLAQSCGWHDADRDAFMAGYYGAIQRELKAAYEAGSLENIGAIC